MIKLLASAGLVAAFWSHYGQPVDVSTPEAFTKTVISGAPAVKKAATLDFEANALPKIKEAVADFDKNFSADIARINKNANAGLPQQPQKHVDIVAEVRVKPVYFINENQATSFKYCYKANGLIQCFGEPQDELPF
jgi:hypothetical protein